MEDPSVMNVENCLEDALDELEEFVLPHGWVSYIPTDWDNPPEPIDSFGDSPHHTGFLLAGLMFSGHLSAKWLERVRKGYDRLYLGDGSCRRNIQSDLMNRDQWTTMFLALVIAGANRERLKKSHEWIKSNLWLMPHHSLYFDSLMGIRRGFISKLVGYTFEVLDTILDFFPGNRNRRDSSIIKNVLRTKYFESVDHSILLDLNRWLLGFLEPEKVFERYFSFRHFHDIPTPPIHLVWKSSLERD